MFLYHMLATTEVNGKVGNSTPAASETPEPIVTWICMGDYVGAYPSAKFYHDTITPFRPPPKKKNMRKCASSDSASFFGSSFSIQPRSMHWFSWSIRHMTSFRARMYILGVPKTKILHFDPFYQKTQIFGQFLTGLRNFYFASIRPQQWGCSSVNYA